MNIILSSTLTGLAPIKKTLYEILFFLASSNIEFQLLFTSAIVICTFGFSLTASTTVLGVLSVSSTTFWTLVTVLTIVWVEFAKISATIT